MFSSGPNYVKLKTHLRLAINRLKLIEKKKTELAQKARKEIADYISAGKYERAKIRVEHIIREDYLVEAFECVEMYCDLLLARFGLIQQMKTLDDGIAEAVSSVIWVAPRIQADIQEMKVISELLAAKYGKTYADACREESISTVSAKLKHKMNIQAPPKLLVEKYLIEIAKNYNIAYEPDPQVMREEEQAAGLDALLDLDVDSADFKNNLGGGGGGGGSFMPPQPAGFIGYPQPPMLPQNNQQPFNYPSMKPTQGAVGGFVVPPPLPSQGPAANPKSPQQGYGVPFSYNIPPGSSGHTSPVSPTYESNFNKPLNTNVQDEEEAPPPPYSSTNFPPDLSLHDDNTQVGFQPKPSPRAKMGGPTNNDFFLPELPSVPTDTFASAPSGPAPSDEIDFDDLTRRFEDLKKKK